MRLNKVTPANEKKATAFVDTVAKDREESTRALMAIVHEIRNPLTAIKMTNQLMHEAFEKGEQDELLMQSYMMILAQNIARIEERLREALNYHKSEPVFAAVNIRDCLDIAVSEARDRIFLGGIMFNNNNKGDHWVYGNAEKLTTAFLNIIINSIEAIKSDKGMIWISVYEINNTIRITFKDNGGGMEPHIAAKMFDPYFTTKEGLGIGLSAVKEIMTLHKAQIVADSLPGIGTSINILFNRISPEEIKRSNNTKTTMSNNH